MIEISPIVIRKVSEELANHLREQILSGSISPGTLLPNERELSSQTGLSRASVREALRILAVEGLLTIRTGRTGGAEVVLPSRSTVERSVDIFIRGQGVRFEAVLEARQAIEPQAARLAALHHTQEDWNALQRCHQVVQQASADGTGFLQANLDWHLSVVQAGHNELLIAFVSAFARPIYDATTLEDFNSRSIREAVVLAHQRVMDAIAARDPEAAGRRMARHVGAYVDRAHPSAPQKSPI